MYHHQTAAVLTLVVFFQFLTFGNSSPVGGDSSWLDKLPSLEVKVKTDGITVRTGPSRDEIYAIVGYIILGLVSVVIFAVGVTICVYKCCLLRRSLPQIAIHGVYPSSEVGSPHYNFNHNPHNGTSYMRPITNTGFRGNSIISTHVWPSNRTTEHLDMKTIDSDKPVTPRLYRSTS